MSELLAVEGLQVFLAGRPAPLLGPLDLELSGNDCLGLIGESGSTTRNVPGFCLI